MKQFPISNNGAPDLRYSIKQEFCGQPEVRFVVRYCGEWVGQTRFYSSALMLAVGHNQIRKGASVIVAKTA